MRQQTSCLSKFSKLEQSHEMVVVVWHFLVEPSIYILKELLTLLVRPSEFFLHYELASWSWRQRRRLWRFFLLRWFSLSALLSSLRSWRSCCGWKWRSIPFRRRLGFCFILDIFTFLLSCWCLAWINWSVADFVYFSHAPQKWTTWCTLVSASLWDSDTHVVYLVVYGSPFDLWWRKNW